MQFRQRDFRAAKPTMRNYEVQTGMSHDNYGSKLPVFGISGEPIGEGIIHRSTTLCFLDGPALRNTDLSKNLRNHLEFGWHGLLSSWPGSNFKQRIYDNFPIVPKLVAAFTHAEGYLMLAELGLGWLENRHGHSDMVKTDWNLAFSSDLDAQPGLRGMPVGKFSCHAHRYQKNSDGAKRVLEEFAKRSCIDPDTCMGGRLRMRAENYRLLMVEMSCEIPVSVVDFLSNASISRQPPWSHNDSPTALLMWVSMDTRDMLPGIINRDHQYKIETLTKIWGLGEPIVKRIKLPNPDLTFVRHE
ncbi:Uncharacterised protein [uncultured archaeon]|nr:Uncharacterised protein [uncultured archaeon]